MKTRSFAVLIPAVAALAFAAPAAAATSESVSENWAGYEATTSNSSGFSAASGSWVVPKVSCTSGATYSADWVGLGGGDENSDALEQQGTQADCSASGKASYYAWYELVPSAPVKIKMTVSAGDKIWARTAVSGDQVTVEVDNKTTGQDFTKTLTMKNATPDTSTAEWVAEAPSECAGSANGQCQTLPLSDFGTVTFTNAYATSDGQTKSVSGWTDEAIALSPASGSDYGYGSGYGGGFGVGSADSDTTSATSEGAAPGALSANGTTFTVTYGAAASSSATGGNTGTGTTTTSGYGYGYGYGYGDSGYGYGYGGSGYGGSGYGGYGYGGSSYADGYGYGLTGGYGAYGGYGYGAASYGF